MKAMWIIDNFFSGAHRLRKIFDNQMDTSKPASPDRFIWDYWHVGQQYSFLRTPASQFFKKERLSQFEQHLLRFGKKNFGCVGITPLWLSCYINGSKQGWHCDVPHGPLAFVFSLTQLHKKNFTGGETCILKNETLHFWSHFHTKDGIEEKDLIDKISPKFNRLIVFDPRRPHSVSEVKGTQDPRLGRVVIHGWFTYPPPFVEGGLRRWGQKINLNAKYKSLLPLLKQYKHLHGYLGLRLKISQAGKVTQIERLISTLQSTHPLAPTAQAFENEVQNQILNFTFPQCQAPSTVSFPVILTHF